MLSVTLFVSLILENVSILTNEPADLVAPFLHLLTLSHHCFPSNYNFFN